MARPGLERRTPRRPCEHSDHWANEVHGRPVTIPPCLIRFGTMPEPTRQPLCCSQPEHGPTLSHQMLHGRKKSTRHDRDSNPGPLTNRASTLTTELPNHLPTYLPTYILTYLPIYTAYALARIFSRVCESCCEKGKNKSMTVSLQTDDRLWKDSPKNNVKNKLYIHLGLGMVQFTNCCLEWVKTWRSCIPGRAFHWTMVRGKKEYL